MQGRKKSVFFQKNDLYKQDFSKILLEDVDEKKGLWYFKDDFSELLHMQKCIWKYRGIGKGERICVERIT